MEEETSVESLPATTEQSAEGMGETIVSTSEYEASLAKAYLAKRSQAASGETKEKKTATEPVGDAAAEAVEEATDETADGTESDDKEQSEEQPDAEDTPVLSKLDPKTQEKIQKRINKFKREAEEAKEQLETYKASQTEKETAPAATSDDPNDKTANANSDADLQQLESDASNTLEFLDAHDLAITRAIAKDQDKVVLAGQEFAVADLMEFKRNARRHLERLIPARRSYLADKGKASTEAKTILPAMFDKSTQEYQEFVAYQRKNPAARSIPSFEKLYALAKIGEKAVADKGKKPTTAKASEVAPKTGADTGSSAAAKPKTGSANTEKARLTVELGRAQKAMETDTSQNAYAKVLMIQDRLKKLK